MPAPRWVSVQTFCRETRMPVAAMLRRVQRGQILGAYRHAITGRWWFPMPIRWRT